MLPAIRSAQLTTAARIVPYLTPDDIDRLVETVRPGQHGDRDGLLIRFLFQTGLRISEALGVTLADVRAVDGWPVLTVMGKGHKPRMVACPAPMLEQLQAYAYRHGIERRARLFPIGRIRAWQIVSVAGEKADLGKKVWCHLLRHSDAIERLRQTGNPRALQIHLGHSSPVMTMRYLSTLTAEDAVRIQSGVKF